jgi:hypothetical protein
MRIIQFLTAAGKLGVGLMTGGLFSFTLALIEHVKGNSFSSLNWIMIGFVAFTAGAFFAWLNERKKVEDQNRQRGRPAITAELQPMDGGGHRQAWNLYLHNSSDYPAVDIHIDDITYNDKVLRFIPPSAIAKGATHFIGCGILCNGWTQTNDILSLFFTDNSVPLNMPVFKLRIIFSSLDKANPQHWNFHAFFWYEMQQHRLILSQQSIEAAL